jgi:hypothetical protein
MPCFSYHWLFQCQSLILKSLSFLIVRLNFIHCVCLVLIHLQLNFFLQFGRPSFHTHRTKPVRIIILCALICRLLDKRQGNKLFCTKRQKILRKWFFFLKFYWVWLLFVMPFPNIWAVQFLQMTLYLFCARFCPAFWWRDLNILVILSYV